MSVLTKSLEGLMKEQCIVDLYRDHLSQESLTGVISGITKEFVYLSLFTEAGTPNGVVVCFVDDVTRIRWKGNERSSIAELVKASGSKPTAPDLILESIESVLRSVATTFGYVNVLTERMNGSICFIGRISELDNEALLLDTFGTFLSRDESTLVLRTSEITRVDADATYERSIAYLAGQKAN